MTWFAANLIIAIHPKDGEHESILVYENIILVEAINSDDAFLKAKEIGQLEAMLEDSLTIDDKPAIREFVGIRKLTNISNPEPFDPDQDPPTNGTEITYSVYRVPDKRALRNLASGEIVNVEYIE